MRKLLLLGALLAVPACATSTRVEPAAGPAQTVGPRQALDAFLGAARRGDLQAMAANWGDREGSIRDKASVTREDLEKRELVMMCYFKHDRYRVVSEQAVAGGERMIQVELTRGTLARTTNFFLTDAGTRWYVRTADMEPVKDLCTRRTS